MSERDPYVYQPLTSPRHIRVLLLEPADNYDAPLWCSLQQIELPPKGWFNEAAALMRLNHIPDAIYCYLRDAILLFRASCGLHPYEALSYVWGSPTRQRPMLCEKKVILITENCDAALRHLRRSRTNCTLWVDSVCIDQSAILERNQQVTLMGDVYKLASRTIIWLGKSEKDMSGLCQTIRVFGRIYGRMPYSDSFLGKKLLRIAKYTGKFRYYVVYAVDSVSLFITILWNFCTNPCL
jgi:hypothetical protein